MTSSGVLNYRFCLKKINCFCLFSRIFVVILAATCIACSPSPSLPIQRIYSTQTFSSFEDTLFISGCLNGITSSKKNYFLSDINSNRVLVFDEKFNFLKPLGEGGKGPSEFLLPFSNIYANDKVFILDKGNGRISVFSKTGNHFYKTLLPPGLNPNVRFAVNHNGQIFASTSHEDNAITHFNKEGEILNRFGTSTRNHLSTSHLLLDSDGRLLQINIADPVIHFFKQDGTLLTSYNLKQDSLIKASSDYIQMIYEKKGYSWANYGLRVIYDAFIKGDKLYLLIVRHPEISENLEHLLADFVYIYEISDELNLVQRLHLNPPSAQNPETLSAFTAISPGIGETSLVAYEVYQHEIHLFSQ